MTAPAALERGPFSFDKYTLDSTTSADTVSGRTFSLSTRTQIDPDINEILEVYIDGVKLKGSGGTTTTGGGDEFFVNSITAPTTLTIVPNATLLALTTDSTDNASAVTSLGVGDLLVIKRISNRTTKNVDYAPGSVIREVDLDSSNTQIIHVAQEAIDTAILSIVLDTDDKWNAQSESTDRKIKGVLAGEADTDAVNKSQLDLTEVTTLGYKEDTEDYKLETADWATKVNGVVNTYTDNVAQSDGTDQSAKAYSIGGTGVTTTSAKGAAKEWATTTGGQVDTSEYSAKEYATGTTAPLGSAKSWSTKDTTAVAGSLFSAKEYASGTSATGGTAKEWATNAGSAEVDSGAGYSSKAYAQNTGNDIGSSKDWAVLGTQVSSTDYSSKQYAVGTPPDGSAKEWAKTTGAIVADSEYSSKEYALGTTATSSKTYALKVDGAVTGTDFSSKAWALGGTNVTTTASRGAAKEWAISTGAAVDTSEYSAKEYALGTTVAAGSAKDWAVLAEGSVVDGGSGYSALHWAAKAEDSQLAAKNSAAAVATSFDSFDDTYLGAMKDPFVFTASSDSGLLLTHAAHGLLNGNIIQVASAGTLPTGLSASTNYYVVSKTTNNFKLATSSGGSAIVYTNAGSGSHTWVYGSPTTNGTWAKDSASITVVSNVGIRIGQKVSGSGIPAPSDSPANPIPNVLSIDGTTVVISQAMAAAGSAVATTFSSLGINGPYNISTDGPSANNDGESLSAGILFFNSTDNEMRIFDGATWIAATSAGSTSLIIYKYVASGSQTTFTGSDANGATLAYIANNINVFLNGVRLDATDYTASNGTSVVLGAGATASDELVVTAYKSFTVADMVPATAGGTFGGDVTHNGNVIMATNKKVQQKGAFMQSSTHQALTLGG